MADLVLTRRRPQQETRRARPITVAAEVADRITFAIAVGCLIASVAGAALHWI